MRAKWKKMMKAQSALPSHRCPYCGEVADLIVWDDWYQVKVAATCKAHADTVVSHLKIKLQHLGASWKTFVRLQPIMQYLEGQASLP